VHSVVVVSLFILFHNKIFAVTFDESFAQATGTKAELYNLLIAAAVAVIAVLAMNFTGSLLVSALVIFPALSAMRIFKSFKGVTVCSAMLSVYGTYYAVYYEPAGKYYHHCIIQDAPACCAQGM